MEHDGTSYYLKYKHYSSNVYLTLKDRYTITGKLATSTEEPLDRKPYWIENDIYNNGKLWSDRNRDGKSVSKRKVISTKAAFIYDALYGYTDDYAKKLLEYISDLHQDGYGWYGGRYLESQQPNKSLNIFTNAAVLEALYYKRVGNFYYAKAPKLYDKIRLHHIDHPDAYYIESHPFELRYDAQKLMESLSDEPVVRIVRKEMNFIVRIGVFDTEKEAREYLDNMKINVPGAHIAHSPVHSDNFMLANRFYKYDYHRPYENEIVSMTNKPYALFLPRYRAAHQKKSVKPRKPVQKKKKRTKKK